MTDRRRTRWVAHDVYFLDDSLGTDIFDRFGAAGVALWLGFIAACKKNHIQGEITYSSETEALALLGLPGMPLVNSDGETFTLEDFFDLLGDHKVTRRSRRARRLKVVCTRWERWQHGAQRQKEAERKRRSGPQNTPPMSGGKAEETRSDTDTDTDTDINLADAAATAKKTPRRDPIFETVAEVCGLDWQRGLTSSERGRINKAAKQLREVDATVEEIHAKAAAYRKTWPEVSLTPTALAVNWSQVDAGARGVSLARCRDCDQPLGDSHDDDKCAFVVGLLAQEVR